MSAHAAREGTMMTTEHEQAATSVQLREAHEEMAAYLDAHEQQYPRADRLSVHVNYHDLEAWQSALAFADAELDALRPLRAALLRYGQSLSARKRFLADGGTFPYMTAIPEGTQAHEVASALVAAQDELQRLALSLAAEAGRE